MKVLILSCNTGEGHNSCAAALEEECRNQNIPCDTEDALRRTEEAIQAALDEVRESRVRYRSASAEQMQACQEKLKADPVKPSSEE